MKDLSLRDLLEAGCHFGHRVERWHPKANEFIFQARDGIHIIDLAKTKDGLAKAATALKEAALAGKSVLFVATKRQAKSVVTEAAKRAGVSYLTNRWIGGFLTNWDEVKKNIEKIHTMRRERTDGTWQKTYQKHEIVKLEKFLHQLEAVYGGVVELTAPPQVVFIVDIKREMNALKEVARRGSTSIAIVDTNADPNLVNHAIPANDDAVGSIQFIVNYLADAYLEGAQIREKQERKASEAPKVAAKEQALDNKKADQPVKAAKVEAKKAEKPVKPAEKVAEKPAKKAVKKSVKK